MISANSAVYRPPFDEVLDRIVGELTGLTVPARPEPPDGPGRPGPPQFAGRYRFPLATYDVVATDDGFDVTSTPLGFAAQFGDGPTTEKYRALSGTTYITRERSTLTFLDGGRYLYGGRVAKRVSSGTA
ncbi:hypothetical protein ACQPZJ_41500 [Actinoplanes sp. CA-054009]